MGQSILHRAFSAGELDPGLSLRGDVDFYARGLRTCRNFVVRRSGGVVSRPGLEHVATCKGAGVARLYAFVFPAGDRNYVVEAGAFYFRFYHRLRGLVGEIATPYPEYVFADHDPLKWHQAGVTVVLTHYAFAPMELVCALTGPDVFSLAPATFGPRIDPPTITGLTVGATGTATFGYVVTAVKADSYEESLPSLYMVGTGMGVGTPDAPHTLTWTAVPGAIEYKVYRDDAVPNGTYGYIGTTTLPDGGTTFKDIGLAGDYAFTPPVPRDVFNVVDEYPTAAAVYQQRRIYAHTANVPDQVFASRVALPGNFTHRSPMQDDDAITWRTVSNDLQVVLHLVSLARLVLLTDRGEWIIRGDSDGGITPMTLYPEQVGYVGAGAPPPQVYGDRVLFVQSRDTVIRELQVLGQGNDVFGRDLTRNAAHLFRRKRLVSIAFALQPDAVLWCVQSDGALVGLTYIPDEEVLAWHRHDTEGGLFEQVVVVPEPLEDAVYVVVNRGGTRTLERLGVRDAPTAPGALDRMVRYQGPPRSIIGGLAHLAGLGVTVQTPAMRQTGVVAADGTVTLPTPVDVADVGVPITCDLETLDLDAGSDVRDRRKKVTALAIYIEDSLQNFVAGPDAAHLRPVQAAPWQDATARITGRVELAPTGTFNDDGRVFLRHTAPTTLTVLGLFPTVDVGG